MLCSTAHVLLKNQLTATHLVLVYIDIEGSEVQKSFLLLFASTFQKKSFHKSKIFFQTNTTNIKKIFLQLKKNHIENIAIRAQQPEIQKYDHQGKS